MFAPQEIKPASPFYQSGMFKKFGNCNEKQNDLSNHSLLFCKSRRIIEGLFHSAMVVVYHRVSLRAKTKLGIG
jgi:hypothetical protein